MLSSSQRVWMPRVTGRDTGNLLVADADPSTFMMVRQLTAPDVWQVAYAESADGVMQVLRRGEVRLAIVDLAMVDASPFLAEELLARSRRGLCVVLTTDEHNEANERRARTLGPVFYAPKPLNIAVLNHVLNGALEKAV